MGLICNIIVDKDGIDCSNGGLSSQVSNVTLLGCGGHRKPSSEYPAVKLVRRIIFGAEYLHAEPVDRPANAVGPMFGGAFIYSSDSRFNAVNPYPIPLHDRFETQEEYDLLSR